MWQMNSGGMQEDAASAEPNASFASSNAKSRELHFQNKLANYVHICQVTDRAVKFTSDTTNLILKQSRTSKHLTFNV